MGEYADAIINGEICAGCLVPIEPSDGGMCGWCKRDERRSPRAGSFSRYRIKPSEPGPGQRRCPTCRKVVKIIGLNDHHRDAHGCPPPLNKEETPA